jgi:alpha-aminoadipate carrier protein LysW
MLCRLLNEHFSRSRLVPRAMLLLGEEAERAAHTLSQRAHRRLAEVPGADVRLRDYYLSDAGLDRYSKLGVVFDFNEATGEFVYDGKAYRELVRRFPGGEEATLARQRLELTSRKMARQRWAFARGNGEETRYRAATLSFSFIASCKSQAFRFRYFSLSRAAIITDPAEEQWRDAKMPRGTCPECDAEVQVDEDTDKGDVVECSDCATQLEVVGLDPIELDVATEEEEEDWTE